MGKLVLDSKVALRSIVAKEFLGFFGLKFLEDSNPCRKSILYKPNNHSAKEMMNFI